MKAFRSRQFFLSLVFALLTVLFGCRKEEEKKNNVITVDDLTRIEEKESKILSHDFGVIHYPVEDQKCEFEITNTSKSTWHLERIINTCSCAVADISSPKIKPGETSADGLFTLDALRCIGACGIAPAVTINGTVYPKMSAAKVQAVVDEYLKAEKEGVTA